MFEREAQGGAGFVAVAVGKWKSRSDFQVPAFPPPSGNARQVESPRHGSFRPYFDLVREMKNPCNHRLRLVESARLRGIKLTARLFATTVPTVRKWLLDDISRSWRQAQRLGLPTIQYTAGEIRSGLLVLGLCRTTQRFGQRGLRCAASSTTWIATAFRSATRSGKPTTAASSRAISPRLSVTASTCASRPPRTPIRATWKPCIS